MLDLSPSIRAVGGGSGVFVVSYNGGTELGTVQISSTGGAIIANVNATDAQALGACSAGCGDIKKRALNSGVIPSEGPADSLVFKLTDSGKTAQSFALSLLGLDDSTVIVSITYRLNGNFVANVMPSVSMSATSPHISPVTSLDPGSSKPFDEVVIQPIGGSKFFVSSFRFCASTTTCP